MSSVLFLCFTNDTNINYLAMKDRESYDALLKGYDRESIALSTPPIARIIIFELIGISLLTLGVNNSVYAHIADIFVATSLFVAIIFSGPFSGGHVNPAVTMGTVFESHRILCQTRRYYLRGCWDLLDRTGSWRHFRSPLGSRDCWESQCTNHGF